MSGPARTPGSSRWSGRSPHSRRSAGSPSRRCRTSSRRPVIVLISGYALGGGPGFAVGAIAGLASNFFFGQGPVHVVADGRMGRHRDRRRRPRAGLARADDRPLAAGDRLWHLRVRLHRGPGCRELGSRTQPRTLTQLGVYVGQGLGFDAIYAASSVVFALAFGPALLRAIQRFTKRLEYDWLAPGSSVLPLLAVAVRRRWPGAPPSSAVPRTLRRRARHRRP